MTNTVRMSIDELDRIQELLEITEQFLRTNLNHLSRDLDELLTHRGITGGPGWLIDTLGATAFGLRTGTSTSTTTIGGTDE